MNINDIFKSNILKEFLNENYLDLKNLEQIKNTFLNNKPKSIELESFFKEDKYNLLKNEIKNLKYKKDYNPIDHNFSYSDLGKEFKKLFNSKEFNIFIEAITNKKINNLNAKSILLQHKDYTLLKDEVNDPFLEINFFFTDKWNEAFGGYFSYIKNNEELLRILSSKNSVILVDLDLNTQRFVKYINSNSGKNKIYLVSLEIR